MQPWRRPSLGHAASMVAQALHGILVAGRPAKAPAAIHHPCMQWPSTQHPPIQLPHRRRRNFSFMPEVSGLQFAETTTHPVQKPYGHPWIDARDRGLKQLGLSLIINYVDSTWARGEEGREKEGTRKGAIGRTMGCILLHTGEERRI